LFDIQFNHAFLVFLSFAFFEGKALPLSVQLALDLIVLSSFVMLGSTSSKFNWHHSIGSIGALT